MIITATIETIQEDPLVTGPLEDTTVECQDYHEGFAAMQRTLPEGQRILNVRVQR
ncbi:hypothetical protein [Arthrobacter sp. GMC3]|uniref:hypothetical protein n=1 Tax=Arthrobacter sp. GMC3 TaxID=2058894 RepID=UPI0015E3B7AA|nr:hypothetical protein [Arthrobacter sp. GMC3]